MGAGGHQAGGKGAPWLAGVEGAGGTQGRTLGRHVGRPPRATAVCAAPASARLFNQRPARALPRPVPQGWGPRRPRPLACTAPAQAPPRVGPAAGRTVTARCTLRNSVLRALPGPPPGEAARPALPEGFGVSGTRVCY